MDIDKILDRVKSTHDSIKQAEKSEYDKQQLQLIGEFNVKITEIVTKVYKFMTNLSDEELTRLMNDLCIEYDSHSSKAFVIHLYKIHFMDPTSSISQQAIDIRTCAKTLFELYKAIDDKSKTKTYDFVWERPPQNQEFTFKYGKTTYYYDENISKGTIRIEIE